VITRGLRNEDVHTKIGVAPIEEKMRENCLDDLIMYDVDLRCASPASRAYQIMAS